MFQIISTHENEFGFNANWNYFEAGHGKGPCDGIGGTVKCLADDAVAQNKVVIQDPHRVISFCPHSLVFRQRTISDLIFL